MKSDSNMGWRTRTSRLRTSRAPASHADPAPTPFAAPAALPGAPVPAAGAPGGGEIPVVGPPWTGVHWSLLLVGFLGYIWVVITYSIPIGDVSMALALVGLLLQRESLRVPPFLLIFVVFIAWGALGYFHSPHQATVLDWSITMGKVWLICLVAVNALRTPQRLRFFIFFALGAFALYPVRGALVNYFLAGYNVFGRAIWNYIYANPNDLAALTLLPTAMVAALLVREPKGWPRLAALAGAFVLPLLILMTQSRAALLALGVAVLLGLGAQRGRRVRALVTIAVLAAVVAPFAPSGVWDRLGGLANATDTSQLSEVDEEGSAESRYAIWRVALALGEEKPILGHGLGAYQASHGRMSRRFHDLPRGAQGPRDTHSTYLNLLAEVGWPGLLLFLAVVAATLGYAERIRRRSRHLLPESSRQLVYLELGVLAFLLAGIFGSFSKMAFTYVYLSLVWAQARLIEEQLEAAGRAALAAARGGPPAAPQAWPPRGGARAVS